MALIVADASVVVKWLVPEREGEADVEPALHLLRQVQSGEARLLQPVHWLVEAAAVAVRLTPATAARAVALLDAMAVPVLAGPAVVQTACRLAVALDHPLFDTLYHAVALESDGAVLVTADDRYARRAEAQGRIVRLADYRGGPS